MCGLVGYGDLLDVLQSQNAVKVEYRLASVKIIPPSGENDPRLFGDITSQALTQVEIEDPDMVLIGCMAVTVESGSDGYPSSWSAALDALAAGVDISVSLAEDRHLANNLLQGSEGNGWQPRRLIFVSAGNVQGAELKAYPEINLQRMVQDPAQAWNVVTVGAYTEKVSLSSSDFEDYKILAKKQELSPFSTTSRKWGSSMPCKPDLVFEGGNVLNDNGFCLTHDGLSLLTLHHLPSEAQFRGFTATSAATALASRMAAQIQARYPDAWPETIRALMIHSADWPEPLASQFNVRKEGDKKGN